MSAPLHTPGPLPVSVAEYWESSARSMRIEAKRARCLESRQLHLREAMNCEAHAARVRDCIAQALGQESAA